MKNTILFALVITICIISCNKEETKEKEPSPMVIKAVDVENGYTNIEATVKAIISGYQNQSDGEFRFISNEITSTNYVNNGFEITLPAIIPDDYLFPISEENEFKSVVVSDVQAKTGKITIDCFHSTGIYMGTFVFMNLANSTNFIYADRSFTAKGNNSSGVVFDCSFKQGWNIMYLGIGICTTKPIDFELKWHFAELNTQI